MPLPDLGGLNLDCVEWMEESWDYSRRAAVAVSVNDHDHDHNGGYTVIRWAVGYPTYREIKPPVYETREVTFEIQGVGFRTQEVSVLVDPGIEERLSDEELAARKEEAKGKLLDWLRHVVWAAELLKKEGSLGE